MQLFFMSLYLNYCNILLIKIYNISKKVLWKTGKGYMYNIILLNVNSTVNTTMNNINP